MVFLTLGDRFGLEDRASPGAISGWGIPGWAGRRAQMGLGGTMKPLKVGARYFCGDCGSLHDNKPVAMGNKFTSSKAEYQAAVLAHMEHDHPDLHYPTGEKPKKGRRLPDSVGGGSLDYSSSYRAVARPRELPDFTEFDFPDATVTDGSTEELEFDQLISIAARQGRRFLGVELQGLLAQYVAEYATMSEADLEITTDLQLNTRTGAHNLDDPENLWRLAMSSMTAFAGVTAAGLSTLEGMEVNEPPVGGQVYVAPRLFWRFGNFMDRSITTGVLFARIATISQPLSTFLLFELLEQYSGLFGFAA